MCPGPRPSLPRAGPAPRGDGQPCGSGAVLPHGKECLKIDQLFFFPPLRTFKMESLLDLNVL